MEIIRYLWILIQFMIGYNLVFPLVLWVMWLIFGKKSKSINKFNEVSDYAIIVTAYEETSTLPAVVDSILRLKNHNFVAYIVADNCDISELQFEDARIIVLRPPEVLRSNTASHRYAAKHFVRNHNRVTIIDSDNLVHPNFLDALKNGFDSGYSAIQGLRAPKNTDSTLARLDAARDIYYHFYDGKVLFELGSSATLAGSGMAFEAGLYRDFLDEVQVEGAGFDKVLQNHIVGRNIRIAFVEDAIVYDEKTTKSDQLVNQRSRWINTWFKYFKLGFGLLYKGLSTFSINQLLFGMVLLRPPLFIFLLLSLLFLVANLFVSIIGAMVWGLALLMFVMGFMVALWCSNTPKSVYRSLTNIPVFIFHQVISLVKSRSANKRSVATKHYHAHTINTLKK